jgi:hypothetical protein
VPKSAWLNHRVEDDLEALHLRLSGAARFRGPPACIPDSLLALSESVLTLPERDGAVFSYSKIDARSPWKYSVST